ncbi:hypothetical protein W909_14155 [Dickeya zeae EC1]|nr:hypothetical protein W909_14155 [Dickeya zeae EC1]
MFLLLSGKEKAMDRKCYNLVYTSKRRASTATPVNRRKNGGMTRQEEENHHREGGRAPYNGAPCPVFSHANGIALFEAVDKPI